MSNEINFVDIDAKEINREIIKGYEDLTGEILYPGDERRIFLQNLTPIIVGLKNRINDSAKQNLLRYARGEKLDAIGEDIFFTKRLGAEKASCKCICKLSKEQQKDIVIRKGTRVSPDGAIYFKIRDEVVVKAGQIEIEAVLEAENEGPEYNGFIPGQIKFMVDLIPFIDSIINTEMSTGGSNEEEDRKYEERCRLSQKAKSTAGPDDAYIYFAISAHPLIVDAYPISPSPGIVKIMILLQNADTPNQEILDKVLENCSRRDRRPLTDKVEVAACEEVLYDINLTYYLDKNHSADESNYRKNIEGINLDNRTGAIRDYINWQQCILGNSINPDELRYRIQDAATYETVDKNKFTAVRKIELTSPTHTEIIKTQVAKIRNINVTYGGLD